MHKKITCTLITLLIPFLSILAQTEISGKIYDPGKIELEGVNIALMNARDSSYVTGRISNYDGLFSITGISSGKYILSFSMMGYKKQYTSVEVNKNQKLNLNATFMEEDTHLLSTVTIEGKQDIVRLEADKTIVNVASSILGSQGTAYDALRSSPGVFVKEDGSVILNGQTGAIILINGRTTYLTGENLTNLLKSMPASSIDKIELITTPSARYDASGKSGLINIKLQKNPSVGISGSINASYFYGEHGRGRIGGRFSFQNDKFSISANASHYQGNWENTLTILRQYSSQYHPKRVIYSMHQSNYTRYKDIYDYFRVNFDYNLSEKMIIGGYSSGTGMNRGKPINNYTTFSGLEQIKDSVLHTVSADDIEQKTFTAGTFIEYKDNSKREADLTFDYLYFDHSEELDMISSLDTQTKEDKLRGDLTGTIRMFSMQGNTSIPLEKDLTLKAGIKSTWVSVDNETDYSTIANSSWIGELSSNNRNEYSENINAIYGQLETKIKKININAGIRLENTIIKNSYYPSAPEENSSYQENYTNLFPYITMSYTFPDENNNISLLYNKRITRPNYRDMLPFNQVWDKYTMSRGNPNLKSGLTDNLEFVHIFKQMFRTTLFFFNTKKAISQSYLSEGNNMIVVFPDNITSLSNYGIRFSTQKLFDLKWWQPTINAAFFRMDSKWNEDGEEKKKGLYTTSLSLNNQFIFGKGWSAEIYGFYNGKVSVAQTNIKPFGGVSLSIQKKIMKDNANIKLFMEDLFKTNHEDLIISYNNLYSETSSRNDSRIIGISFSYNFKSGNQKIKNIRERSIDESKRINL